MAQVSAVSWRIGCKQSNWDLPQKAGVEETQKCNLVFMNATDKDFEICKSDDFEICKSKQPMKYRYYHFTRVKLRL
eukprot:scaffold3054_cov129-Cylindrotheca_fusiformis.AAC.7